MLLRERATAIYVRHRMPVWRYLHRLTGSRDQAEDLCQEVFLRVVAGLERYEERGWERAWVFQIARRVLAEH
jgi:RNA polymerase sigma-70 factor (ECF subfamily)